MNPAVRIQRGYYLIDPDAWVDQRVGERDDDFTALLREFTDHDLFREHATPMDVACRVVLWCAARGWAVSEGSPLHHDDPLTRPVSINLATAPGPSPQPVAIVIGGTDPPVVYPDVTTDEGYWYQAGTIDIVCPGRHRFTWLGDGEAIDDEGEYTTIRALFGPDPHAPYRQCRTCAAYEQDPTWLQPCDCGDVSAIYCPRCADRCQLHLPDVPTHPLSGGHA